MQVQTNRLRICPVNDMTDGEETEKEGRRAGDRKFFEMHTGNKLTTYSSGGFPLS